MEHRNLSRFSVGILSLALLLGLGILPVATIRPANAITNTFQSCDIFTAVSSGNINWYRPDTCPGIPSSVTFQGVLSGGSSYMTGMGFDEGSCNSAGVVSGIPNPNPGVPCMYATDFGTSTILVFDNTGAMIGTCAPTGAGGPAVESVEAVQGTGGVAPGIIAGGPDFRTVSGSADIETGPLPCGSGATLTQHPATGGSGTGGTDWVDLSADKCTVLYTGEGSEIRSANICTDTQNADFIATGSLIHAYALKILPDASVVVADTSRVAHISSGGVITSTCDTGSAGSGGIFSLDVLPGGAAFATGSFGNNQIDYLTIAQCDAGQASPAFSVDGNSGIGAAIGTVFGVAIFGEAEVVHTSTSTSTVQGVPEFGAGPGVSTLFAAAIGIVAVAMLMRTRKLTVQKPIP
jgi:hypothetical protein